MSRSAPQNREGMALLTVLLLVAVMAAVCVLILDDVRFSVRRTSNVEHQGEMQAVASLAEALAKQRLSVMMESAPQMTPLTPRWNGVEHQQPTDTGTVTLTVRDAQSCFNLNSLVFGQGEDLRPSEEGALQFVELGVAVGLPRARMRAVAEALTDWMDSGQSVSGAGGAEDGHYAALSRAYRTSGLMLAEVSELRVVKGVDGALYDRLRPYLCALPEARLTQVNVNTLGRDQAPVLTAIAGGQMRLSDAEAVLSARPSTGWKSVEAFWTHPALNDVVADEALRRQTTLLTQYFDLRVDVEAGDGRAVRTALIHVSPEGVARTHIRRWMTEE